MNYYEILGVSRTASQEEIAKAFRTLAKEYHPDINRNPNAKNRFIEIYEAYSILKDDKKRSIYDKITFGSFGEYETKEKTNKANYSNWQETAREEARYYSETKYKEFSEKVLRNIKAIAKTTKVILGFFGAMILCGLISTFIIGPILRNQIEKAILASEDTGQNYYPDNNGVYYSTETSEDNGENILPLPLPPPLEGWERITIENVGSLDIPPSMELQGGYYQVIKESMLKKTLKTYQPTSQIIIQQKGLNDLEEEGFSKYARVMFKTEEGEKELTLDFNINEIPQGEIIGLDDVSRGLAQISFSNTGLKLIEWYPLKLEKINGMSCIHTSYKRQLNNNEPVMVNSYLFFNYDYNHILTMSYRLNEREFWEKDFQLILNSLHITKGGG
jgi:hypothetical protein